MTQPRARARKAATIEDPPGEVRITLRDVYDMVVALGAKVEQALPSAKSTSDRLDDHEVRLRALEANRWPLSPITIVLGVIGALMALGGLVVSIFALMN